MQFGGVTKMMLRALRLCPTYQITYKVEWYLPANAITYHFVRKIEHHDSPPPHPFAPTSLVRWLTLNPSRRHPIATSSPPAAPIYIASRTSTCTDAVVPPRMSGCITDGTNGTALGCISSGSSHRRISTSLRHCSTLRLLLSQSSQPLA